ITAAAFTGSRDRNRGGEHPCVVRRILRRRHLTPSFPPAGFADRPNPRRQSDCLFSSRLSLGKIAEGKRPRRHPKASGTSPNLVSGTPSSVPCRRFDACRAKGVPSMCDYSLDLVASRPAKVGDELVTRMFENSMTRGFAAIGEPNVAVCL